MGKNVFANGLEISAKASSNRSIAAMPDVCLSPPGPPAGPIPIPYPNTALATHTVGGSRTVKIGGREVGKKNISKYSKSTGDEPATRNFGMGVISHNITGPMKFAAWSMDVKAEGANVTRFMDLTTHNHSNCTNGAMSPSIAGASHGYTQKDCEELANSNDDARKRMKANAKARQQQLRQRREKPKKPKTKKSQADEPPKKKAKLESQEEAKKRTDALEATEDQSLADCTITHAIHRNNGMTTELKACSNALLMKYDTGFVEGLGPKKSLKKLDPARKKWINEKQEPTKSQKGGGTGNFHNSLACFGTEGDSRIPFRYSNPAQCTPAYASHTESRIIDEIYKKASGKGGSLLLCVDWPNGEEVKTRRSACTPSCQKLICAALACMDILMCDEDDQPRKPDCVGVSHEH